MADAQIKITAETSQAQRALGDLDKALGNLDKEIGKTAKLLAGITAGAAAMGYAIIKTVDSVGDLADMAKALGVSAQNLKYLQQSAVLAGVGADELNGALLKMNNNIGTALISKTGPASAALRNLGIDMTALKNASPDKQFQMITRELSKIPDPALRSSLAMDLLGKQGPRLLEAANAMDGIRKSTEEMGLALSDLDIAAIERAGDAMDELKGIVTNGVQKAVAGLAPYIIAMVNFIKAGITSIRENADAWMAVAKAVGYVILALITFRTYMLMTAIIQGILAAASAMLKMYETIKLATTAMEVMNAVMGKNPIVKIISAVLAIGTMIFATKAAGDAFAALDAEKRKALEGIEAGMKNAGAATNGATTATNLLTDSQLKAAQAARDAAKANYDKLGGELKLIQEQNDGRGRAASIEKAINDERVKLVEKGAVMSAQFEKMLRLRLEELQAAKDEGKIREALKGYALEQVGLAQRDVNLREQNTALRKMEFDLGRQLTEQESSRLREAIQYNQQLKERNNILDAIEKYSGTKQIPVSVRVEAGLDVLDKYNPAIKLQKDFEAASKNLEAAQVALREQGMANEKAYMDAKLKMATDYQLQQMELDNQIFQNRNKLREAEIQNEANKYAVLASQQKGIFGEQLLNQDQIDRVAKATAENQMAYEKDKTGFIMGQASNLFNALGAHNKKAFEMAKALNIATTIMNTYRMATEAYLSVAKIPFIGPALGIAAAVAAIGFGMAQVSQIRSQTYSGKAVGGPMVGGKPYLVGERGPEIFTPGKAGGMTKNSDIGGGGTVVNFNITANDTTGFDELLTSRRQLITTIIADAQLEKGMR